MEARRDILYDWAKKKIALIWGKGVIEMDKKEAEREVEIAGSTLKEIKNDINRLYGYEEF